VSERRRIDPSKVKWHHHSLNEKVVEHYMRHPNKPFDGQSGTPYVEIGKGGRMYGANGAHRAEAARRTGRKLDAVVVNNPARTAAFSSGCMVMSVALVGVVVLGLARMRKWGR
jgi:hypothetical protein